MGGLLTGGWIMSPRTGLLMWMPVFYLTCKYFYSVQFGKTIQKAETNCCSHPCCQLVRLVRLVKPPPPVSKVRFYVDRSVTYVAGL